jgi:hypothetical protein
MDGTGLTASDVALLNNDGMGGTNGMIWLFAILALMGGGFGGWGNNGFANAIGYENLATSNEVQRGFDTQNIQAQTRDILQAVNNGTAQSVATTNQTFHDTLNAMQGLYNEVQRDVAANAVSIANLRANQDSCCCSTKMLIQQTASDNALQMSQMEARLTQKMDADKIESLQNQINKLELAQATNGMLKFPNSWSYGAGPFPPIFGGCCGQSNI